MTNFLWFTLQVAVTVGVFYWIDDKQNSSGAALIGAFAAFMVTWATEPVFRLAETAEPQR